MEVLLIHTFPDTWLLPLSCVTEGRRNCVVLSGPNRGSFRRVASSLLHFVDEEDLKRGLTEWEDKQQIRRQVPAYTEAQQPSEASRVSAIEGGRGPSEEEYVDLLQHKLRQDMGQL
jgi:hypothetical protein